MPLFEFENVTVLRGGREVLHRVSFTVGEGEHVAIVGPNDLSALLRSRSNALEIVLSGFFSSATLEPFHDLSPAMRAAARERSRTSARSVWRRGRSKPSPRASCSG